MTEPLVATTPQPLPMPGVYGPEEFPQGYNPLSGQPVADPALLDIPAMLISISHFPPAARPQAGLSFASFVYEYFITEGATRYLSVFYGEQPAPEVPLRGNCDLRQEPIPKDDLTLGNRVWYDGNKNGVQEAGENGGGGICVDLLDANDTVLQKTTTDSNGYYGFIVGSGSYRVRFEMPAGLEFASQNAGDEGSDSDADPATGRTDLINVSSSFLFLDAGLVPSSNGTPTPDPSLELPLAQVGPVRSGRLLYRHLGNLYQDSCLIYASADPVVLAQIPGCATVPHTISGGGAMLSLERLKRIQEQVSNRRPKRFDYASNLFSEQAPTEGKPANELDEFWARLNQTKWVYDSASQSWWRYVDESDPDKVGVLHNDIDRLTGRQLKFENIVLLFAQHTVITPTIVDIDMQVGLTGTAFLFRDGGVREIRWSTRAGKYEQTTGLRRPIRFLNQDGTPAALKPGHTWVIIFNFESYLEETSPAVWRARFIAPAGAKNE